MCQEPPTPPASLDDRSVQRDKMVVLGRLTACIAHDLNNPIGYVSSNLNSLRRYLDTLTGLIDAAEGYVAAGDTEGWRRARAEARWDFLVEDLPQLLAETRDGAEHLKRVVGDLKFLSRSGVAVEELTVDECVRAAQNVLAYHFRHGMELETRLAATTPLPLVRGQIIQALTNLIYNSIQACGETGGRIRITTRESADGAELSVEDDGPGVPPELRERIFEPHQTTKDPAVGTGLGLAIVRRIARAHAGDVDCSASPDLGGARFRLRLRGFCSADQA